MVRTLLQVPLSLKLLVANGVLMGAAVATGAGMGRADPIPGEPGGTVLIGMILLGMIGINWVLVKIALGPLKGLQEAADRVSRGDLGGRVPASPVADRALLRLISTFNEMVEATARTREARDRLSRDLLEAGERDRKALAEALLSGPAQTLSTTLLLLRRGNSGEDVPGLAADGVREALEELRRISAALHPPELDELGLANALRALIRSRLESRGIETDVEVDGTDRGLPPRLRLAAFRLIQEAVEMAARIPGVGAVALWLRREGSSLLVHVRLSGLLVEPGDRELSGAGESGLGSGLHRMFERSRLLGGDMEIQGGPGPETAILIRIPVDEAPAPAPVPSAAVPA